MFTRRTKTVASVMESFRNTITDLQEIIENTVIKNAVLNDRRIALDKEIWENADEIKQARGIEGRLSDLVFGPDPQEAVKS